MQADFMSHFVEGSPSVLLRSSLSKNKQINIFIYSVSTFMVRQAHHERETHK